LNTIEYQNLKGPTISDLPESNPPNSYGYYQGSMSNHDKVYENLIDVLQNNTPIAASANDGIKTVELIEQIYHAFRNSANQ
jgi:UDP-N-acetyl-2-amino-2-deoxyglucuronate dehydrogenase